MLHAVMRQPHSNSRLGVNSSGSWSAVMDGYKLFRRDLQGRRGVEVAGFVKDLLTCMELFYGVGG